MNPYEYEDMQQFLNDEALISSAKTAEILIGANAFAYMLLGLLFALGKISLTVAYLFSLIITYFIVSKIPTHINDKVL
jgi:hypothetical protein